MGWICLPFVLWIVLNTLANCGKPRPPPPSVAAARTPESSASSSSARKKDSERKKAPPKSSRAPRESNAPKPPPAKKEPPPEERKEPTPPAKKEEESQPKEEKKAEPVPAQSVKTVKKEAVKVAGITDFVDQAKTTKAPLLVLSKEEDPGDGNYEDVNLTEAVAPEGQVQLVTVEPPSATFPLTGGQSAHNILNVGENRIVFKVKCSNNNEYGIRPVFGFVEANSSTMLHVTRLAGKPKEDKMVVEYVPAPAGVTDAMVTFRAAATTTTIQSITVPLVAVGPIPGVPGAGPVMGAIPGVPGVAAAKPPVPAPMPASAVKPMPLQFGKVK
ncbi:MSP domain protein [Ancylostoma ceylanicum]|uniref:Major sperm protein n=1 Tax=Ancylostoma ceylanicum TaxID=53326 RepID=A0A0D6M2F4_9BILA|nr:MSP domain protein [Ancylostoma ceylanicum]